MKLYLIALLFYLAGLLAALAYELANSERRSLVITYPQTTRAGRRRYEPSRWEATRLGLAILFNSARFGLGV